jgi:hypothetical protein
MNKPISTYTKTPAGAEKISCGIGRWAARQSAALLLFVLFMCVGGLVPGRASAATDTYYFQNVASSSVCTGISTINQSGEANALPGGPLVNFTVTWQWRGPYHFGWNAGAYYFGSTGGYLNGISAQDMYTVPYTAPMTITGLSLRLNYDSFYGLTGASTYNRTLYYAKFYDVDGNSPCQEGTLIAQTAEQQYIPNTSATLTAAVSGLSYNMQPGHRIRVESWHRESNDGYAFHVVIKYGAGTTTGLTVDQTPTLPDTCTVGPGEFLADATIFPDGPETALDAFTLQTSTGSDAIQLARVSLSPPGSSSLIGSVSIKSDDGGTLYGAITNPTSEQLFIPLSTVITATTTPVQYKIMVTPKTAAAMPTPVGATYPVRGYVSQFDSSYTKVYNDTPSATVLIENITTDMPAWGSIAPGDSTIALNWTNPAIADFQSVLILRGTSPVTAAPTHYSSYTVGSSLGASKVVYSGNLQTFTDGLVAGDALWNGTPYYYKIFTRKSSGVYSSGATTGPFTPMQSGTGTASIGNGTDPSNALAAYNVLVNLDAFTLTSSPNAHLNSVAFSLAPGMAPYIQTLQLIDGSNSTIYGTIDNPASDTVVFSGLNNAITNNPSSFMVRIKASNTSRPPAGTETLVTGRVTGITLDNANITISNADTASTTLTIDHIPPANPVVQSIIPYDGCVRLNWTPPADGDLSSILILRNTSPITDVPQDGTTYSPSGTIGTSTVVYSEHASMYGPVVGGYIVLEGGGFMSYAYLLQLLAAETTFNNCGLVNWTPYYYKIFARDLMRNYSSGVAAGPATPLVTVTVGNGTDPVSATIVPGGGTTTLDAFTLTATSTNTVNEVTVALSPGSASVVGAVRITSSDGGTVYGSVTNPAADTVSIVTAGLSATAMVNAYRVEITPRTPIDMPAPPGSEVAVTGRVTALTTAAVTQKTYNDTTSAALTVDNLSPANPGGASAVPLDGGFNVSWANPLNADFSSIVVLRDTVPVAGTPIEGTSYTNGAAIGTGTVAYTGNGQLFIERGLTNSGNYYYRLFALDTHGNYSAGGTTIGPVSPQPNNITVAGTATAVIQGLDAITVAMPFTDDANGNGTCAVEYKLSAGSSWTPWAGGISRSTTTCTTTITGLTAGSPYDVRMTYGDSDGVLGTASQTVTGIVALSLIQTTAGEVTAVFDTNLADPTTIVVSALYSNDYNHNNSCTLEYKLSSDSDWISNPDIYLLADGQYRGYVTGVQSLTRYDVRLTFMDPDGVNGIAVKTIFGVFSPSQKNPNLLHNSITLNSTYWGPGGWGIPGGMYGEFTCQTCHVKRTPNAAGIKTVINGLPVLFNGTTGPNSFGDDSVPKPDMQPGPYKICEVCHTQTYGRIGWMEDPPGSGIWVDIEGPIHRNTTSEPSDHARSNGQDCTECHPHDRGFGVYMGP